MNIVIETGLELDEELRLQKSFEALGLAVTTTNYLKYQDPPLTVQDPVFLRGSLQAMAYARKNYSSWLIYESSEQYSYGEGFKKIKDQMLNREFQLVPFGELKTRQDELFDRWSIDNCIFIRPDAGNKAFTGSPVSREDWFRQIDRLSFYDVRSNEPVVVYDGSSEGAPDNDVCGIVMPIRPEDTHRAGWIDSPPHRARPLGRPLKDDAAPTEDDD